MKFFSARKVQQESHFGDRKSWVEIHVVVPNVQEEVANMFQWYRETGEVGLVRHCQNIKTKNYK